jgi:photosystem II stability/assembly factor-like uncharacterized protein
MAEIQWMKRALPALVCCGALAQSWQPQTSGTRASLRGISAVRSRVAWASGTGGTYLITTDGGATWRAAKVQGAETLDFRAVHALDARTAWLMSIGTGPLSRVYKTTDGGAHWQLQFTNPDPQGFFDCLAFWDARHGILVGDAVDGALAVFTTTDGGAHWQRLKMPPAVRGEGAFAASNSALVVRGKREAFIGTTGARVYRIEGDRVNVVGTPVRKDSASAGIFSLAFADGRRAMAVGGDYTKPKDATNNISVTADGGATWTAPQSGPAGFRSAVVYLGRRKAWLATGPSGSDITFDDGKSWKTFDAGNYNALGFSGGEGWAVGPNGRIGRWRVGNPPQAAGLHH